MGLLEDIDAQNRANYARYGNNIGPLGGKQPQQQGFNPASLLSPVLGTVGAIGGGIIGGPGGALAGGALGGGAGSALEQALSGRAIDPNKVVGDAALSGLFAYGPLRAVGAVTGLKGGRLAAGQLAARRGVQTAAQAGAKAVAPVGVTKVPNGATIQQLGIAPELVIRNRVIGPARAQKINSLVFDKIGVKASDSSRSALPRIENYIKKTGEDIGNSVASVQTPKTFVKDRKLLSSQIEKKFSGVLGGDYKNSVIAKDIQNKIRNVKTPKDLWNVKRELDQIINQARAGTSAVPNQERFAKTARTLVKTELDRIVPNYKSISADYNLANDAFELVAKNARSPRGLNIPLPFVPPVRGDIVQRGAGIVAGAQRGITPGAAAPAVRGAAVQPMSRLEEVLSFGGTGRMSLRNARQQAAQAGLAGPTLGQAVRRAAPNAAQRQILASFLGSGIGTAEPSVADEQSLIDVAQNNVTPQTYDPYPVENMMYDVSRDPKNSTKYIGMYNAIQTQLAKRQKQGSLTGEQQKFQGNALSGLKDLAILRSEIERDPTIIAKAVLPGGSLKNTITGAGKYAAATQNIVDTIARLRTGAAITADEAKRFMSFLPGPFDDAGTIESKLNRLEEFMSSFAYAKPAAASTVEEAIIQAQGGF